MENIDFSEDPLLKDVDLSSFLTAYISFLDFIQSLLLPVLTSNRVYEKDIIKKIQNGDVQAFTCKFILAKTPDKPAVINAYICSPNGVQIMTLNNEYSTEDELRSGIEETKKEILDHYQPKKEDNVEETPNEEESIEDADEESVREKTNTAKETTQDSDNQSTSK